MFEIRKCRAPRRNAPQSGLYCDQEFTAFSMNQLYCSRTCCNRAQKVNYFNRKRAAGYGTGRHQIRTYDPQKTFDPQRVEAAKSQTADDIERTLTIMRLTAVDSEAELAAIGYSATKKAERWSESDRAAEPRKVIPTSDEPPQFDPVDTELDPDDPYATLNQPDKDDL